MRLVAIGIVLIGVGALYVRNPNIFRRGIWNKTSIAIRLLSPEAYVRYIRALGFAFIAVGAGLVIYGAFVNAP